MGQIQVKWSEEQINQLFKLRNDELSLARIAEVMNRSKDSIRHKIKWLSQQTTDYVPRLKKTTKKEPPKVQPIPLETKPMRRPKPEIVVHRLIDYCGNCHAPVSNWTEHLERMKQFGCRWPAAKQAD